MITKNRLEASPVYKLFATEKPVQKGLATISSYKYKDDENPLYNMRLMRDGLSFMRMYEGEYVRLHVDGKLMMSDTNMERETNRTFLRDANGRVLIGGLGIGLIIKPLLERDEVTEIVVVEKYKDVIDLVEPKIQHPKLKVINADIFEWRPTKGEKFDTMYFDIWPDIDTDNLSEIKKLHNSFKNFLNRQNPKAWMNSWLKEFLQRRKKQGY